MLHDVTEAEARAIKDAAVRTRRARIARARKSCAEFARYVLRDEETNGPIELAPYQEEWHDLIEEHRRVGFWAHIEAGKTQGISVAEAIYRLGLNPNLRIVILSSTEGQSKKILRTIKRYMERSPELREVFPKLRAADVWTETQVIVHRDGYSKDPSIVCIGQGTKGTVGSRVDLLIIDDILNSENTRTHEQREKLRAWFNANVAGRLTPRARVVFVGTAWHPEDLLHQLAKRKGYQTRKYGVLDENGEPRWPARWPLDRIAQATEDLGGPGSIEVQRQLHCIPVDESTQRFPDEAIKKALEEGEGLDFVDGLPLEMREEGYLLITGVDLAPKKKKPRPGGAVTSFATLLRYPDGKIQLLNLESGNWTAPEIADKVVDHHKRYGSVIYVEDNAAQVFLLEMFENDPRAVDIAVRHFHTTGLKWDPGLGIESIANEMKRGFWILPNDAGETPVELGVLLQNMRAFSTNAHTPDRLMALWIARMGVRAGGRDVEVGVTIVGGKPRAPRHLEGEEEAGAEGAPAPRDDGFDGPTADDGRPLVPLR